MKKILAIVIVLAMVMALGVTAFADDIKVAFSQIGQESDWRTANTDSIKGTIEGHEGWTLIYDDAQQKQENQIKALRNFITQGVARRSAIRSRAVSFPLACWASMRFSPPPSRAFARRSTSFWMLSV